VKILVIVKRVEDPEIKIAIRPDGLGVDTSHMKYVVNPFDEIAVEEALRLRDTFGGGEVIVATIGVVDATQQLRTVLAMGADRGIHVKHDEPLCPSVASKVFSKVVAEETPDLVVLGKQAIDDDLGQIGIMLAEHLGWGQATFASKEASLDSDDEKSQVPGVVVKDNVIEVVREVDGAVEKIAVDMPAVVTTELRLNTPRYASLPGIMKAKKKEIKELTVAELGVTGDATLEVLSLEVPPGRKAGVVVEDVAELVEKLRSEARVI